MKDCDAGKNQNTQHLRILLRQPLNLISKGEIIEEKERDLWIKTSCGVTIVINKDIPSTCWKLHGNYFPTRIWQRGRKPNEQTQTSPLNNKSGRLPRNLSWQDWSGEVKEAAQLIWESSSKLHTNFKWLLCGSIK